MIIKGNERQIENTLLDNRNIGESPNEKGLFLEDGIWFSEKEPILIGEEEVIIDTEKDFLGFPYETYTIILFFH